MAVGVNDADLCRRFGHQADLGEFLGTDDLPLTTVDEKDDQIERYGNLVSHQIQSAVRDRAGLPIGSFT